MACPLCNSLNIQQRQDVPDFFSCTNCDLVFKNPKLLISSEEEKERYLEHNNDVENLGYQNFVAPIVDAVQDRVAKNSVGLDFGAGTGPVISKLLKDKGYTLQLYDPFFHPDSSVLDNTYDYIICCEVMEHFYHPFKEFQLLFDLLRPNSQLFCMTNLLTESVHFKSWSYRNDKTHVCFYSEKNIEWIKVAYGFSEVFIDNRLIVFKK